MLCLYDIAPSGAHPFLVILRPTSPPWRRQSVHHLHFHVLSGRYLPRIQQVGGGGGSSVRGYLPFSSSVGKYYPGVDGVPVVGGEEQQIGLPLLHGGEVPCVQRTLSARWGSPFSTCDTVPVVLV